MLVHGSRVGTTGWSIKVTTMDSCSCCLVQVAVRQLKSMLSFRGVARPVLPRLTGKGSCWKQIICALLTQEVRQLRSLGAWDSPKRHETQGSLRESAFWLPSNWWLSGRLPSYPLEKPGVQIRKPIQTTDSWVPEFGGKA